ncbi:MAG: DUF1385 domain-containing protein [Anaerolineaceae bacterium]|nr:DUF1385 domain-containing protein [Anaerolineaceae bacterium]
MNAKTSRSESRIPHYGGQALIEGVLMRGKSYVVAVMRKPDKTLHMEYDKLQGIYISRWAKIPLLRGLVILWDSLYLGMKFITKSANLQAEEDAKIEGPVLYFSLLLSITFAIGLFFILPTFIIELFTRIWKLTPFLMNLLEGLVRLIILIAYIWVIGQMKDIARVFAYHGAEHKIINAYEQGIEITVENVKDYPLAHPRCGTSFLLSLVFLSIIMFTLIGPLPLAVRILSRIAFVPFIAMFAYEFIRWMSDHLENPVVKLLTYPNLLLQKLTTREPSPDMLEVAISSFKKLLQLEQSE